MLFGTLGSGARVRQTLQAWLAISPSDASMWATLAHWQAQDGLWDEAYRSLKLCLAQPPPLASSWFNFGFVCERLERTAEAEHAFRRAVELDPSLDRAWYGLALSLIAQERLAEAVPALEANTRLQPMSPHGWYQLARVHTDLGALDDAHRIIHRLHQFEPKIAAQLEHETGLSGTLGRPAPLPQSAGQSDLPPVLP
ncbi:tetratricopeptide repeat protein [Hydrogenophaga sp. PAMC20947]|uniref:tetratricopeptide repeat protein n=1 Tax=Hydrogenophaga sp. PAMC20947 TaxID=2565558 RepID=UPI001FFB47DC|nr:tetratricopeptide repeat protein [Hydrogenophaga sp. PAMC20947]